jgi:hypothetical protein
MKKLNRKLILAASLLAAASTAMATDVGVSISVGDPNFYGRINIGNVPTPRVIYQQPVIVERPVRYVEQQPIYLRVPPGHAKKWSKHCGKYNACGQRVYFVQDSWYANEYAPYVREHHGHDRDDDRGHDRDDRHGKHDKHGKEKGHGNGHGKGH